MPASVVLTSFNAGELSPKMLARCDVSQYSKGCQTLENFLVTPYGAIESRPGTQFITTIDSACRLIRFAVSRQVAYVCIFTDRKLAFLHHGKLLSLTLATPYTLADLDAIKFVQCADVMTLVHPDHPVYELKRTAEQTFTLAEKSFSFPPMLDPNLDDSATITPSARSGTITLAASKDTFAAGNVGGYFQIVHTRKNGKIEHDFKADGVTAALEVKGFWTFVTHGTWTGVVTIQRSFDNGTTWNDYQVFSSAKDSNTSTSGEETDDGVLYQVKMSDYEQSSSGTLKLCRVLFSNPDFVTHGIVKITKVDSAASATGKVIKKLGSTTATAEWNEGAWSVRRGFPRAVAYLEERLIFAGTAHQGSTIWGSATGAWDDFLLGDQDDDAFAFTLASDTVNAISWMVMRKSILLIGTIDSEWTLTAADSGALTPSNFKMERQSVYGSSDIAASMVGESALFIQRGNRKVRELAFSLEDDGFVAPDMTILADHITASGIKETALQQHPDSIYWCLLNNGTLAALTYERKQEVVGWHRHTTRGTILSLCVIPAGDEDEVYWAVDRRGVITLEKMFSRPDITAPQMDCTTIAKGSGIDQLAGFTHLEGQEVQILGDFACQRTKTVSYGVILLDEPADTVAAGLPFTATMQTMPLELQLQSGFTLLKKKQICELRIRLYDSSGGCVTADGDPGQQILSRDVLIDNMDTACRLKSEVVTLHPLGGASDTSSVTIKQESPLPLNVSALTVKLEITE